ncbi:MAG: 1-deoxy-D-xylulose-5-phosphate synthase [Prevotellaceae bacterium]|jgi:1-deoxy-D-xylulose-5-phosphate synthase|nr:1-deoxy-D-xylulose-5-phosphate synthase [Prevotellaceae bacterium]
MLEGKYPLLESVEYPDDLKKIPAKELPEVCQEIRDFIIDEVSENPGHFGASLGAVEIAVALHYVFNTPYDKLVWDVGHQAYAHKILTGRREMFHTNRKYGGLSGFPKMAESKYDAFGAGHSSTSISAALGLAVAAKMKGEDRQVVAIIGDGSMTGGMAFEGLNHAGIEQSNLLVILNDNQMAIDPNVGALKDYLLNITTSKAYNKMKDEVWSMTEKKQGVRRFFQKTINAIKGSILHRSNLFESLNFRYFGPVDGHDINTLIHTLNSLKNISGPKLLHVLTKKGKGYKPAEENQTIWHAPGTFDRMTGKRKSRCSETQPPLYQQVFGETIVELAEKNPKIAGVTPAMPSGCSLNIMMEKMPDRTFDVGIAEQHAVTFSAGLAASGYIPYCNIYSSFMQRGYDSVIHDVALQNLPVIFCLDRAGLVGEDGATHHGAYDIAYMRNIPNMIVAAPLNEVELRNMMYTAQLPHSNVFSIRYPRGTATTTSWRKPFEEVEIGKARKLKDGNDIAILSIGHVGNFAAAAIERLDKEGISATHFDMRFAKPIDEEVLHEVGKVFEYIITVEDGTVLGGMGSAVAEFITENEYRAQVTRLGIPDRFVEHGTIAQLQAECGFDEEGIFQTAMQLLGKRITKNEELDTPSTNEQQRHMT